MFYSNERIELRKMFFNAWQQYQSQVALQGIDQQILQVILEHPEYHEILSNPDKYLDQDYLPEFGETNPYLHMSLHLSIRDQVNTNRPLGIIAVYQPLLAKFQGRHLDVEHEMMNILVDEIWQAQRNNRTPDQLQYLEKLKLL